MNQFLPYVEAEKDFFKTAKKLCDVLYSETPPTLDEYDLPPRFVRWIGQAEPEKDAEIFREIKKLESIYRDCAGDAFKRLPRRFPKYFTNVVQVNLAVNPAFMSFFVPPDTGIDVWSPSPEDPLPHDHLNALDEAGFKSARIFEGDFEKTIWINSDELYSRSNGAAIQCRKHTGKQYVARVFKAGDTAATRMSLGFFILSSDTDVDIVHANPQPERPHTAEKTRQEIELPIPCESRFFFKNK